LHSLLDTLQLAEHAPVARELISALISEPLIAVLVGAILAWAAHSSVAMVVLRMALAAAGLVAPQVAFALPIGANLGTAVNPLLEGSGRLNPANRRLPVGNLINRLVGCVIFRPLLTPVVTLLTAFDSDPVRLTANFHMLFNIVMAVPFLFLLGPFAALLERWLPEVKETNDVSVPRYLDESVTESPAMALTCATRETMRMADLVDSMLQSAIKAI